MLFLKVDMVRLQLQLLRDEHSQLGEVEAQGRWFGRRNT
jgi:hypothetical protein